MIEVVSTKSGHHVRLKARNGKILMWSENYKRKANLRRFIESLRKIDLEKICKKVVVSLLMLFSLGLQAQIRTTNTQTYTYTRFLIPVNDSLNYDIDGDSIVMTIPEQDLPFRWEVFVQIEPYELGGEDTELEIFECGKGDTNDPLWAATDVPNERTIFSAQNGVGQKIKGSSLGGKIKIKVYKNGNGNGIGFYVRLRVQWVQCAITYDPTNTTTPIQN